MIELKLQIEEINYEQLAEKLIPLVLEKGGHSEGKLGTFLKMASVLPPKAVGRALAAMPQDAKDELVVLLLNAKKDSILAAARQLADRKGISVGIRDMSASVVPSSCTPAGDSCMQK